MEVDDVVAGDRDVDAVRGCGLEVVIRGRVDCVAPAPCDVVEIAASVASPKPASQ